MQMCTMTGVGNRAAIGGRGPRSEADVGVTVTIDPELCIGSGDCGRLAPAAFELRDDLGVSVPRPGASETDPNLLVRAAVGCPTQAIRVVAEGGAVLHAGNSG